METSRAEDMLGLQALGRQLQGAEAARAALQASYDSLEAENVAVHSQLASAQAAADDAASSVSLLQLQVEALQAAEQLAREHEATLDAALAEARQQAGAAQDRCTMLEAVARDASANGVCELEMMREQLDGAVARVTQLQDDAAAAALRLRDAERIEADLRAALAQHADTTARLRDEVTAARDAVRDSNDRVAQLEEAVAAMRADTAALAASEATVETLRTQLEAETAAHEDQVCDMDCAVWRECV